MKKLNWKSIVGWGIVVILVGLAVYVNSQDKTVGVKVKVAINTPLTGLAATYHVPWNNGFKMGVRDELHINNLPEDTFFFDIKDNQGQTQNAFTIWQTQENKKFDVYISGTSHITEALRSILDKEDLAHLPVAWDADLIKECPNCIRLGINFNLETPLFLNFVDKKQAKKVFIVIHDIPAYLNLFGNQIYPVLKERNIDFKTEAVDLKFKDYRILMEKIRRYNPDVILLAMYDVGLQAVAPMLKEYGLTHDYNTYAGADFLELIPKNELKTLQGFVFTAPIYYVLNKEKNAKWEEEYQKAYRTKPTYMSADGYDVGRLTARAYIHSGKITPETIMAETPADDMMNGRIELNKKWKDRVTGGYTSVILNDNGDFVEWKED
ncbi:MAG: ABC transporter substrate-binding protein [Alphaproteobacteria bacterium]|nr:ABC transporter substrate-binding protein [Alphaproteobacteria bacterium]